MSCPLFNPATFSAYTTDTDYVQGDVRKIGDSVYICTEAHYGDLVAINYDYWINVRDINYFVIYDSWAAQDGNDYRQFDVVCVGDIVYMALTTHTNDTLNTEVTDTDVWIPINEACLLGELYIGPTTEYDSNGVYSRGESVSYEDKIWAFLPDRAQSTETPGTNASIESGKQWHDIDDLITVVDIESDNTQSTYDPDTSYNLNDKVEHSDRYYVSTHDNNQNRTPGSSPSWQYAHEKEPVIVSDEESDWGAGSYDWGVRVKHNDKSYLSREYNNTIEPGLDDKWKLVLEEPILDCSGSRVVTYDPNFMYNKYAVVSYLGINYISTRNNNTDWPTNTDSWTICPTQPSSDCSLNSSGLWSSEPYYNANAVVEVNGNFYIAVMANVGQFPPFSRAWQLCKGSGSSDCEDENTTDYDAGTTYGLGDTVRYQGNVYISQSPTNTGNTPGTNVDFWLQCKKGPFQIAYDDIPDNEYETLVYSETIKAFDQFFDFRSSLYMEVNGKVYSYHHTLEEFIHQYGEPGTFHDDTPEKMVIKIVVNDQRKLRKVFDHIMTQADTNEIKFDQVTVRTNFADSGSQNIGKNDHTYKLREGVHTMPARGLADVARMKGNWMEVSYEITGEKGQPYVFRFIGADYLLRISPRR